MRALITVFAMAPLAACQTTQPLSAASMDYRLPRTDAAVTLTLTLKECEPLKLDADLKVAAKPGAHSSVYRVPGEILASNHIRRGLSISVSDKGVIKGVNAENADRTPQIVGNILKTVTTLAPVLGDRAFVPPACPLVNDATRTAVLRAAAIERQILTLRSELSQTTAPPTKLERQKMKDIELLSAEIGGLRAGPLLVETTGRIKLEKGELAGGPVELDMDPFSKWFNTNVPPQAVNGLIGLVWTAAVKPDNATVIRTAGSRTLRTCKLSLPMPNPVAVDVSVSGQGSLLPPGLTKTETLPAAQLGDPRQLCIDVGFGEARSIQLAFDDYGRTTEFKWSSEATAEAVSGAVAGYATDGASLITTLRGKSDVQLQKDEIERIKTQNELDALRACEAAKAAGGVCGGSE